jgi:NADPH:quinone reductase-like Zn-dependent oxidoreductase
MTRATTPGETMRAAERDRYGPPEVVEVRDVPRPVPSGDEVLVRVVAAAVNRADLDGLYPRWQFTRAFSGIRRPRERRVGLDVAGVIEAIGPDASTLRPGDRVFGDLFSFGQGAFGEYVCVPEKALATIPDGTSFEEAATLPHSAILAIQGLRLRDGRTAGAGDKVLIVGASGNVGPFAVQLARSRGAEVTGVCSTDKVEFVRSLGADHVIDYTRVDYTTAGERYDWILDVDGRHSLLRARRALRPKGVYVHLGGSGGRILQSLLLGSVLRLATGKRMGLLIWWKPFDPTDVATLKELVAAGTIRPVIDRRYPLAEVVEALRWVDDGHARGKVIITV